MAGAGPAVLFDTRNGRLSYDSDGADGVDAVLIATLVGVTSLAAGDIII